jgi:Tol biopolymer transport system component
MLFIFIGLSCDTSTDPTYSTGVAFPNPYDCPSITADGKTLYFLRTKITKILGDGAYAADYDSSGLWRMDMATRKMEFVWNKFLITAEISPDGNSLLYDYGGTIYKANISEGKIDTSSIIRRSEVSGHLPAWNTSADKIAYVHTICDEHACGIWLIDQDNSNSFVALYGGFPAWIPNQNSFLFQKGIIYDNKTPIADSLWIYSLATNKASYLTTLPSDTRYFKYNFTGNTIIYTYQTEGQAPQVWIMDKNGNNRKQLTTYGAGRLTSTPDNRIIYLHHNAGIKDINNGTLWRMNMDGTNKEQLTYNDGMVLE